MYTYGQEHNSEPSDQTDLNKWRRLDLNGDREPTYKAEIDILVPQADWPRLGPAGPTC